MALYGPAPHFTLGAATGPGVVVDSVAIKLDDSTVDEGETPPKLVVPTVDGDKVVVEGVVSGTHQGFVVGLLPADVEVSVVGAKVVLEGVVSGTHHGLVVG